MNEINFRFEKSKKPKLSDQGVLKLFCLKGIILEIKEILRTLWANDILNTLRLSVMGILKLHNLNVYLHKIYR